MKPTPVIGKTTETTPDYALKEEADAIHGVDEEKWKCRSDAWTAGERKALYQRLNRLNQTALCLSGGGIRSASFALGIIQALASHPRPARGAAATTPETSLLGNFHYLSTVSGGGYIGSWLSLWIKRAGFPAVWAALTGRPEGADIESPAVAWLRENSNYLTPKLGLTSADFWTAVALYVRNLILNWFVIVPWLAGALIALKIYAGASTFYRKGEYCLVLATAVIGVAALLVSLRFSCRHRPSRKCGSITQAQFFQWDFPWAVLGALALSLCIVWAGGTGTLKGLSHQLASLPGWIEFAKPFARSAPCLFLMIAGGVCFAILYAVSWTIAWPMKADSKDGDGRVVPGTKSDAKDFLRWTAAGAAYGMALGLGVYLCIDLGGDLKRLFPREAAAELPASHDLGLPGFQVSSGDGWAHLIRLLLPSNPVVIILLLGVPWALYSQLFAEMVFVGLASFETDSDADREWFGRKSGLITAFALAWPVVMYLVFVGSDIAPKLLSTLTNGLGPIGGVAGLVTLLVGKSAQSPSKAGATGLKALSMNFVLAIAAPVFAAVLVVLLSAVLDNLLLGGSLVSQSALMSKLDTATSHERWCELAKLFAGFLVVAAIGGIASRNVNINRFSLHAIYRNRLIRAYMGASRTDRKADPLTNFDLADNEYMYALWPTEESSGRWPARDKANWRPFLVLNMALNIVSTRRLAWQERKAESFTTSPLHSGSRCLAFRSSARYGGPDGITLGTAMAISGAAASPNMGYHSSTGMTFLLALFNVRLGWWLGNPGPQGEATYTRESPYRAARPLLFETFGLTTDDRPFVYLSDGGHFENLGLYEMVRRRCRFIVVSDAGCDPDFVFEDLGNAVRKISIDLGIEITFKGLEKLKKRPPASRKGVEAGDVGAGAPYHAIGTIHYDRADGGTSQPGVILYVKAGYHGVESAGVRSYALAHKDFPHQTTADQWFTESQLESYRALGFEIMDGILSRHARTPGNDVTVQHVLQVLHDEAASSGR